MKRVSTFMKELFKIIKNNKAWSLLVIVLLLFNVMIVCFFRYADITSFTVWSVNFWDLLYEGRLEQFYEYANENVRGAISVMFRGNYFTIFPWIIWNFPIWITHYFSGNMDVTTFGCIFWSKLLLIVALCLTSYFSYKICLKITNNSKKTKWIIPFILGSAEIIISIGYAGQDEIIYIMTFLMAVYFRMISHNKLALLLEIMTVTLCPIMLMPLLTVYVFYEKKIYIIVGRMLITLVPTLLFTFLYRNNELFQSVKNVNISTNLLPMLNTMGLGTNFGFLSISTLFLGVVYFICYFLKSQGKVRERQLCFALAVTMFIESFLMCNIFYRFCIYIPFFLILIFISENERINVFLFTILVWIKSVFCVLGNAPQNMNTEYLMPELVKHFKGVDIKIESLAEKIGSIDLLVNFQGVWVAIMFLAVLLLLVINNPFHKVSAEDFSIPVKYSLIAYYMCFPLIFMAFIFMILH